MEWFSLQLQALSLRQRIDARLWGLSTPTEPRPAAHRPDNTARRRNEAVCPQTPASPPADKTDHTSDQDDQRKRRMEKKKSQESRCREPDLDIVFERPPADPRDRFKHDRKDRSLQAEEESLNRANVAENCINPAESHDGDRTWRHEQDARGFLAAKLADLEINIVDDLSDGLQ
jgi:hypothetical protein